MTDLVERFVAELDGDVAIGPVEQAEARADKISRAQALIAAVLDDLMEPTEGMVRAGNMTGFKTAIKTVTTDVWQAMLAAKRAELKL